LLIASTLHCKPTPFFHSLWFTIWIIFKPKRYHKPLWTQYTSYPSPWMMLSYTMIPPSNAGLFWYSTYRLKETIVCSHRSRTSTTTTGRHGLGPKPGIHFHPRVLLCCLKTFIYWIVIVGGLISLLIVWYLFAAFDITDLSESSPLPTVSIYATLPTDLHCCPRELPHNYFSLLFDIALPHPQALNAHRSLETFDPACVATLHSNRGNDYLIVFRTPDFIN
jgi:hypothetical protein